MSDRIILRVAVLALALAVVEQYVRDNDPYWSDGATDLVCQDRS